MWKFLHAILIFLEWPVYYFYATFEFPQIFYLSLFVYCNSHYSGLAPLILWATLFMRSIRIHTKVPSTMVQLKFLRLVASEVSSLFSYSSLESPFLSFLVCGFRSQTQNLSKVFKCLIIYALLYPFHLSNIVLS